MSMVKLLNETLHNMAVKGTAVHECTIYFGYNDYNRYRADPESVPATHDPENPTFYGIPIVKVDRPDYFRIA